MSREIKVSKTLDTIDKLSSMMSDDKPLFYSRFGDGDILVMNGGGEMYHDADERLAQELRESLSIKDERYLKGVAANYEKEEHMRPGMFAPHWNDDSLEKILKRFTEDSSFESAVAFHYAYCFHRDVFDDFIDSHIKGKRVMYIGSTNKDNMEKLFGGIKHFIKTPERNSYKEISDIWSQVTDKISDCDVVIPSSGMTSRVINKRLWKIGANVKSIDFGSVVDDADGRQSRTWIRMKNK